MLFGDSRQYFIGHRILLDLGPTGLDPLAEDRSIIDVEINGKNMRTVMFQYPEKLIANAGGGEPVIELIGKSGATVTGCQPLLKDDKVLI